jgi:hypothetical protein
MPLLPVDLECDLPEGSVGCNSLFLMGEAMLNAALEALDPFQTLEGCDEGLDGFVSLGPSNEAPFECNYVCAWLVDYGITVGSSSIEARAAGSYTPILDAHWRIEIWEGSYPMMRGEEGPHPPPRDLLHAVNRHVYAHGEAVYHALINADLNGMLFDYAPACQKMRWGRLTPLPVLGNCGGWQFDVTGDVPDPGF